jgi:hypothetical protein
MRLGPVLVAGQVAVAVTLLAGASLLFKTRSRGCAPPIPGSRPKA